MTDVNSTQTSLLDAINISLSCIGETAVSSHTNTSTNVVLAKQIIKEVSNDVQSKGWWFNTSGNDITITPSAQSFATSGGIPEEARRYIAIRAARVLQSRFIGSEELMKFTFQEEQVSLAVLTQAHVRNGGNSTSFNSFPAEIKALGIEEVMFLQGSAEEKLATLRLGTELKNTAKLDAETTVLGKQASNIEADTTLKGSQVTKIGAEVSAIQTDTVLKSQQALTELEETAKREAEASLVGKQDSLITNQAATELKKALDIVEDTTIKTKQGTLIDNQAATELKNALKVVAETRLLTDQEALVIKQALTEVAKATDIGADTTIKGKQGSLIDNQAATELKKALDIVKDTELKGVQKTLLGAQKTKTDKEANLIESQKNTDTSARAKINSEKALIDSQRTQLDAQTAIEAIAERNFYDNGGVSIDGSIKTYRDFAAEMRMMGVQESTFQSTPAYKKVELIKDANKLRTAHTSSVPQLNEVGAETFINKVMRLIGEPPISNRTDNALAAEASRLLEDTDEELQSRGWDFNTKDEEEFEADSDGDIHLQGTYYYIEVAGIPTQLKYGVFNPELLRRDGLPWTGKIKAKTIKRELNLFPQKYKEYLWVRVAILLTELYPQSGLDVQRLPKMEAELRAYFKDRDFDEANYSVFDNYDSASILGNNRPLNIF